MPKIYSQEIKQKALSLRKQGYSYSEISRLLDHPIAKNTFTGWFKNVILTDRSKKRIRNRIKRGGIIGRTIALENIKKKRRELLQNIYKKVSLEVKNIDKFTAKLCLAMLYLGEGGKTNEWVRFGNSDPKIIKLFLSLLRNSFLIDESKLRGTVQCRADQNIKRLENFWSETSNIPLNRLYKTRIDIRTIGKPTQKLDYKGVFVIDYFSNSIFLELKFLSDIIYDQVINKGP